MVNFILTLLALFGLGVLIVFLFGVALQKNMDKDKKKPTKEDDDANASYREKM